MRAITLYRFLRYLDYAALPALIIGIVLTFAAKMVPSFYLPVVNLLIFLLFGITIFWCLLSYYLDRNRPRVLSEDLPRLRRNLNIADRLQMIINMLIALYFLVEYFVFPFFDMPYWELGALTIVAEACIFIVFFVSEERAERKTHREYEW